MGGNAGRWDSVGAGSGTVGMAAVAGLLFAAYGIFKSETTKFAVEDEVTMALVSAGILAAASLMFWAAHWYRLVATNDLVRTEKDMGWTLYAAGYPAMAAVAVGGYAVGLLIRGTQNDEVVGLALGAVGLAAIVGAVCPHTGNLHANNSTKDGSGFPFVAVQTILSAAAPILLIFVLAETGLKTKTETGDNFIVFAAVVAATALGFLSLSLFVAHFRRDRSGGDRGEGILWLAIVVDSTALVLTVASAGYIYTLGEGTSAPIADDPNLALLLLYASATTKVFHWILSHLWSSIAKAKSD
jgi:hypothetical protein